MMGSSCSEVWGRSGRWAPLRWSPHRGCPRVTTSPCHRHCSPAGSRARTPHAPQPPERAQRAQLGPTLPYPHFLLHGSPKSLFAHSPRALQAGACWPTAVSGHLSRSRQSSLCPGQHPDGLLEHPALCWKQGPSQKGRRGAWHSPPSPCPGPSALSEEGWFQNHLGLAVSLGQALDKRCYTCCPAGPTPGPGQPPSAQASSVLVGAICPSRTGHPTGVLWTTMWESGVESGGHWFQTPVTRAQ